MESGALNTAEVVGVLTEVVVYFSCPETLDASVSGLEVDAVFIPVSDLTPQKFYGQVD